MFKFRMLIILTLLSVVLSACASTAASPPPTVVQPTAGPRTLTVVVHDSFAASESVINQFQQENNVEVRFIKGGDAGTVLNKAILSKDNPLGDVLYGVDNTFLSRALKENIFQPYASPLLADIPAEFKLDPQNQALPVDYGDVCPNYDKVFFTEKGITPPQNLEDLLKPEYKGLLIVENPATSSPGLAFLLATIGHFGEDGYLDYWKGLRQNDVLVVNDWESAYYTEFSVHGGTRPIVISYGSSPPAEVIFASSPVNEAPTAVITANQSCFRQIEFVGIPAGSQNQDLGQKWIDFMLSTAFQQDMPEQMFVFPVNSKATLPDAFQQYTVMPEATAQVDPDRIASQREAWLQAWTEAVLR